MNEIGPDACPEVDAILSPSGRSREKENPSALMDQCRPLHRLEDPIDAVVDWNDKTCRQLLHRRPGVHQGGGIRQERQGVHRLVELLTFGDRVPVPIEKIDRGDVLGDPHEHLIGGFDHLTLRALPQVSLAQDLHGVLG
jgi:hypothetical protein